ncbi:MAG: DUF1549 domain-containing protein, partial [Planctomycetaceae bacterium]|nr:DUF1549 domain-containing protein [Planctomycetaceae bacterium]
VFCLLIVVLLFALVSGAGSADWLRTSPEVAETTDDIVPSALKVNQWLRNHWAEQNLEPAEPADDLTVLRRLSLALHGTVPSLEEIAVFRADRAPDRVDRWLSQMLEDRRFTDYFAERLSRVLAGVEDGPFVVFRRDRFRDWLAEQLQSDRPWNEMVTDLVASDGLWTGKPSSNFITANFIPDEGLDLNKLAGRTVRAFLGQRIDCAQCHDHPFDRWKQTQFEGLAAYYGQTQLTAGGVVDRSRVDGKALEYEITDPGSSTPRIVPPAVPFHPDWVASENEPRRSQLASWIVHPENRRFERAIANRMWGLMFGRPWHDPVDDLPHPTEKADSEDLLDVVGREFREQGNYSLKFLIRLIARSDTFRLRSDVEWADESVYTQMKKEWAVFPLVRLRPEQMIGSMFQAARVRTADQNSNLFIRFARFTNENDFLKEYGDADDDELLQKSGTIPQALLRMNGRFTRDLTKTDLFTASGQILRHADDDETLVNNCFLACLTRLPDREERAFFLDQLAGTADRKPTGDRSLREAETVPATNSDVSTTPSAEQRSGEQANVIAADPVSGQTVTSENTADEMDSAEDNDRSLSRSQVVQDLYWVLFNSPGFSWNR